ncbi:MAM and LDL-receptor class A domain-containing protein 1-like [Pogonomyrmex barbatus]|uniref:MAM and LDL-receptor class A domain-containing protein 1-like n=1 Tax=Pogonomyrmex barbatus TaxID=144034 RepID=A0A6I9WLA1_9HYME|nr:MAM and LDL-receptor class A domain-containing protein 1-like [Pogonomyrmex barbatus]
MFVFEITKMKCSSMIWMLFFIFGQCIIYSWQVPTRFECPTLRLNNGRIRYRARGRIVRFSCLQGFSLVGSRYSSCIHGQWDTPIPVCVSTGCSEPYLVANHTFMVSKLDGAILMFFCEPGYFLVGSAEIYCDGRQWNETTPYCRATQATPPTKCDFESTDLCWWEQDPQHNFDWKRHNFETPSSHVGTGPTHDHTLGVGNDGHYLYIEASGRLMNDTARIMSPLYNSSLTESGCFSLWYHMYGASIGSLNVYFKQENITKPLLMFTKSGNQGNQWIRGIFNLPKANASFQIIIEGVRGSSYVSDIAIDDIAILQGDQCIVKNESTSVTISDDDQVEIVNSQQTCRNRCSSSESVVFSTPAFGPESCLCTIDCAERSICCPDYAEYCILGIVSERFDDVTTVSSNTTIAPLKPTTLIGFPINPKDDIDPSVSNSISPTTRRPTITTVKVQSKKPSWKTTTTVKTTTTTVKTTQQAETKETPFVAKITSTTKFVNLQDRSDLHDKEPNSEKIKQNGGTEGLMIIIGVGATLLMLSVIFIIAIIVIRRRKTYKRGTSSSALSEDSDVRFLTSDEILDFNLARPTDNDEM